MNKNFSKILKALWGWKYAHWSIIFGMLAVLPPAYSAPQPQTPEVEEQLKRLNEAIKATSAATAAAQTSQAQGQSPQNAPIRSVPALPGQQTPGIPPQGASSMGQNQIQAPVSTQAQAQVQQTAANQPQAAPPPPPVDINQAAFVETTNTLLPMSPDQIRSLHALFDETQRAASEGPGIPPLPTSTAVQVRLEPGATPPVIRLSAGIVTSLVLVDSTGAAWPIKAYSIGNPKAFNIQWEPKSNLLLIQSLTVSKTGNLAIVLSGLNTPIMVTLMSGQKAVDYRVDLRIPGFGPNAKPSIEGLPGTESPYLLDVLNGVPPPGSKKLVLPNCISCELWALGKRFFLRTRFTLLSPAWISKMSSPDGTNAYELNQTPVLLLSEHGKVFTLYVEGL